MIPAAIYRMMTDSKRSSSRFAPCGLSMSTVKYSSTSISQNDGPLGLRNKPMRHGSAARGLFGSCFRSYGRSRHCQRHKSRA